MNPFYCYMKEPKTGKIAKVARNATTSYFRRGFKIVPEKEGEAAFNKELAKKAESKGDQKEEKTPATPKKTRSKKGRAKKTGAKKKAAKKT